MNDDVYIAKRVVCKANATKKEAEKPKVELSDCFLEERDFFLEKLPTFCVAGQVGNPNCLQRIRGSNTKISPFLTKFAYFFDFSI